MLRFEKTAAIVLSAGALAGCGGKSHNYNLTKTGCDRVKSEIVIDRFLEDQSGILKSNVLRDNPKRWFDIVTNAEGQASGPEIINPLVLTCNGAIKYVVGFDRGFTGQEPLSQHVASVDSVNFYLVRAGRSLKRLSLSKIQDYLATDEMEDAGPSSVEGVTGLTSRHERAGYGIMP